MFFNPDDKRYQHLNGKTVITPIFGKEVKIMAHKFASQEKGTGLAMMCSAGDVSDIQFFREQKMKPVIAIDKDGRMNSHAGFMDGLKVRTGSYSFDEPSKKIRRELYDAFYAYGQPTRQSVYNNWEKLIKYSKEKGYDYIKHTTESPDASITFPETVALNPKKTLKTRSQLKTEWDKVNNDKINLPQLAKDVQTQLVPLTPTPVKVPHWSNVGVDYIGDGRYFEWVESPF